MIYLRLCFYTFCPKSFCASCVAVFFIYIQSESLQSSASAPSCITRGCSEKHLITLDPTSWSVKEVLVRGTRQSDYRALTLSLSHRSLMVGLLYSPWYVRGYPNMVRLHTWPGNRSFVNEEESRRFRWVIEWLTSSRLIMKVSFRLSLLRCSSGWTRTQSQ